MDIENEITKIKECLLFLMRSEKARKAEVKALKDAVGGVDDYCKSYVDGQEFEAFKAKFGDKLDPYSETFAVTEKNPDYDFTREVYDDFKGLSDEELKNVTAEDFVDVATKKADEYISVIKEKLGLPTDAKVEITAEDGEVEVKADLDGNGETESITEVKSDDTTPTEDGETDEGNQEESDQPSEEDTAEINKAVEAELKK